MFDNVMGAQGVTEGMDILDPFTRNVLNRMEDDSWLSAEHAYFITKGIQKKHQTNPDAYNQEIQRFIDLYKKYKGQQGVAESQTAKAGIVQTEVYGTKAYHAKCMEPNCDWESKRYDRIQQAQAAAKKHGEQHFNKKDVAENTLFTNEDIKSLYQKIKPLISEASPDQKEKLYKLIEQAKKRFTANDTVEIIPESTDYLPEK
jgi:hypothetical protein